MKDATIIDIALRLLAADATVDWLRGRGIDAEGVSDEAADLYRRENPGEEPPDRFTLEGVKGMIEGGQS